MHSSGCRHSLLIAGYNSKNSNEFRNPVDGFAGAMGSSGCSERDSGNQMGKEPDLNEPQNELRISRTEIVARGSLAVLVVGILLILAIATTIGT
jgi:hypothetical protein